MILKRLLFCACLGLTVLAGIAHAQMPNVDKYGSGFDLDPDGVPYSSKYYQAAPQDNVISLIRKPELTEDQFILRITDRHPKTGCAEISNYGYYAGYKDVYLDIMIGDLTIDMRNQPQYAHLQCNTNSKTPVADIILNKFDLIKNQVKKIRMHNGTDTNYYDVTYTDDMVKIMPDPTDVAYNRRFKPHNIPHKKTSLVYWFYPLGTIIMWVPGMENMEDGVEKITDYAKGKGLIPLKSIISSFESPLTQKGFLYFVDTSGRFVNNDTDLQYGKAIGNITIEKTVYGLHGDETEFEQLPVYARLPGMYD